MLLSFECCFYCVEIKARKLIAIKLNAITTKGFSEIKEGNSERFIHCDRNPIEIDWAAQRGIPVVGVVGVEVNKVEEEEKKDDEMAKRRMMNRGRGGGRERKKKRKRDGGLVGIQFNSLMGFLRFRHRFFWMPKMIFRLILLECPQKFLIYPLAIPETFSKFTIDT